MVLLIGIGVIFGPGRDEMGVGVQRPDSLEASQVKEEPTVSDISGEKPAIAETGVVRRGTGVSRQDILDAFERVGITFRLKAGVRIDGRENYVGQSENAPGAVLQLVGPGSNLAMASSTVFLTSDRNVNTVALAVPILLTQEFSGEAARWLAEMLKADYSSEFERSRRFAGTLYTLKYNRIKKLGMISVSIEAED